MAIRNLRIYGDRILGKVSRPVEDFDSKLHDLLDDMRETLVKHNGIGIAAPQVGVLKRVVVIDIPEEDVQEHYDNRRRRRGGKPEKVPQSEYGFYELVNPVIVKAKGAEELLEACLSLPGKNAPLVRPSHVVVNAIDREGRPYEVEGTGGMARALCHEIDHLDGIMYVDKIEPGTLRDNREDEWDDD